MAKKKAKKKVTKKKVRKGTKLETKSNKTVPYSYNDLILDIKKDKLEEALQGLVKVVPEKLALQEILQFLNTSVFRAYTLNLQKFNYNINQYLKTNRYSDLMYFGETVTNARFSGSEYSLLALQSIQADIIYFLEPNVCLPKSRHYSNAVITIIAREAIKTDRRDEVEVFEFELFSYICRLARHIWPEKIEVLKLLHQTTKESNHGKPKKDYK